MVDHASPILKNILGRRRALGILAALPFAVSSKVQAARRPLIVLDPGHSPKQPGALSARGWHEVLYNDRFVAELVPQLEAAGWRVAVTRSAEQTITLGGRAAFANQLDADLFLSIHHDSTQPFFVEPTEFDGRRAQQTTEPFRGSSIFVSGLNPKFEASHRFAALLGGYIAKLGREPALYHADPVKGENRPLLDAQLGIYQFDGLAVLKRSKMPAVLLEVGVLPDPWDEAWVSIRQNRKAMQWAIAKAVLAYGQAAVR